MERFDAACMKFTLEIGQQFGQFPGRFDFFKFFSGIKHFRHLGKIGRIVGAEKNLATRRESGAGQRGKPLIDKPIFMVPLFGPGIGKINMDGRGTVQRQKILQKIGGFDADAAEVLKAGAAAFAVEFCNAAEQPFNPDKICFGMLPRQFDKERGIAATELDFKRLRLWEKGAQGERLDDGTQLDDQAIHRKITWRPGQSTPGSNRFGRA